VPSFSGRIRLKTSDHPLWKGISDPTFHAWWPSQFVAGEGAPVLAAYGDAMPDAFSSDVNVGDAERGGGWAELERAYQINLDPKRLMDEPAVIEGRFGKGKVFLSLLHFDTPDDRNGAIVLGNLWEYLIPNVEQQSRITELAPSVDEWTRECRGFGSRNEVPQNNEVLPEIEKAVTGLIELGQRNFLWFWRTPQLLQWRRGVRGLEYCTMYVLAHELFDLMKQQDRQASDHDKGLLRTRDLLLPFVDKAKELLVRERFAMQKGQITYERCDDPEVQALRDELFSKAKSYGGSFKELLDEIDSLLYGLLLSRKQPIQARNDR